MDRYVMQSHYLIEFCPSFNYDLVSDNTPWQFTWDIRLISPILRFLKYIYIYGGFTIVSQYNRYAICFNCCIRLVASKNCNGCVCLIHSKSRCGATTVVKFTVAIWICGKSDIFPPGWEVLNLPFSCPTKSDVCMFVSIFWIAYGLRACTWI